MHWLTTLWTLVACLICQDTLADNILARVGNTVKLPCNTRFEVPVDWRYQKNKTLDEEYICTAALDMGTTYCEEFNQWPRIHVNLSTPGDYTLTIHKALVSDSGLYHCVEEQGAGTRHTFQLSVTLPKCASNPCQNNGTCDDDKDRYTCSCLAGFTGTNCESDLNNCPNEPCQNGGICKQTHGGNRSCKCSHGFKGTYCGTDVVGVSVTPQFRNASLGEDVTFDCRTAVASMVSVTWSFHSFTDGVSPTRLTYNCTVLDGHNSHTTERSHDGRHCKLTIKKVTASQAGEYSCIENTPNPKQNTTRLYIRDQTVSDHRVTSSYDDSVTSSSWSMHRLPDTIVCVIILMSLVQ